MDCIYIVIISFAVLTRLTCTAQVANCYYEGRRKTSGQICCFETHIVGVANHKSLRLTEVHFFFFHKRPLISRLLCQFRSSVRPYLPSAYRSLLNMRSEPGRLI